MHKYFISIFLVGFTVFPQGKSQTYSPLSCNGGEKWADSVLSTLDIDKKIAQLFMIAAYSDENGKNIVDVSYLIRKYNIGGLIFFKGGPKEQVRLTNYYQSLSKIPLLIGMDAEWGLGMRLRQTISYPKQMMLAAIQDNHLIYEMGVDIAKQLKRIGVHVNFAPVVDINNNPENPVINSRSFGEDKYNVANKGLAYALGLQDNNIMAVAKHFPGHGDTNIDSHLDLPIIPHAKERLDSMELFPFKHLINNGLEGVMVAHLNIPAFEPEAGLSSSLSKNIIDSLLKTQLNFRGLIFTDALNMKGVAKYYEPGILDAKALSAGNDMLVFPEDVPKAIKEIKKAIKKEVISVDEIDAHCKKILKTKYCVGLDNFIPIDPKNLPDDLNKPEYHLLKRKLIESAITLLENKEKLIPLKRPDTLKIVSIAIGSDTTTIFQQTLQLYANIKCFTISKDANEKKFNDILNITAPYDLIILSIHNTNSKVADKFGISAQAIEFINKMSCNENIVLTIFANPYSLSYFNNLNYLKGLLLSYEDTDISQSYSAQLLFGGISPHGKLPVSVNMYKAGDGIIFNENIRFKYSIPEEVNLDSKKLRLIDSLALDAIEKKATPGCQVLVAKNEIVVYNKSFGYQTYSKKKPVSNTDIYDIASLTKITATLPSLMRLYEEKKIRLEAALCDYLPELDTSDKANLTLIDILTHQARLNAWIPFYTSTMESIFPGDKLLDKGLSENYPFRISNNIYLNRHYKFIDSMYCDSANETYSIEVAKNMYLLGSYKDSIYNNINASELREKQEYKYSDLGFYYLQKIIEKINNASLDIYTKENFYTPLGATNITFLPIKIISLERIIPTENDAIFRRQILQGYVHDPGAAMLGGVAGHAGLFSNANDLAKFMQVYLNKGSYGGVTYFGDSTITLFTSSPFIDKGNRRGIGFDKPEINPLKEGPVCKYASPNSYGHTGFTGTMAWVDPDKNLIYIFLSNRIYPDQENKRLVEMNVRTNIQKVIYESLNNNN